jgi:N-acetylmuramic acid 6-phosphate (MurNAc-6-P) etherase
MARYHNSMADLAPERAQLFEARSSALLDRVPAAQRAQAAALQAQAKMEQNAAALLAKTNPFDPQIAVHQTNADNLMKQLASLSGGATMAPSAPVGTVPQALPERGVWPPNTNTAS